jgi:hypothetical protein
LTGNTSHDRMAALDKDAARTVGRNTQSPETALGG